MTTLKERFAILGKERPDITQADLARATGAKPPSVNAWFSGDTKTMKGTTAAKAAQLYGCSALWLSDGVGPIWTSTPPSIGSMATVGTKEIDPSPYLPGFESLSIPILAQSASMGVGSDLMHDEVVVGRMTVSPQWVSRTIKPLTALKNLRFIHGYGDSMDPTFADGDILLVDVGVEDPKIDGVYVLEANDRVYIKRVRQRFDGAFEISSDNPTVKTVDVLDGSQPVNVRGRVVWVWNGKKL